MSCPTGNSGKAPVHGLLAISMLAMTLSTLIVFNGALSTLVSAVVPGVRGDDSSKQIAQLAMKHQIQMRNWQDQFNGRSPFFRPPAPRTDNEQGKSDRVVIPEIQSPPPKQPPQLGVFYAIGDMVRFKPLLSGNRSLQMNVGEAHNGVTLISTQQLPWSVKVSYEGAEYDVPIFQRGDEHKHFLDHASQGAAQ